MWADVAETVQPKAHAVSGGVERAVSDQPRAEQWRGLHVAVRAIDRKAESSVGDRVLGVPTVDVVAGESRVVAQILASGRAVDARAVSPAKPGDAHAISHPRRLHRVPGRDDFSDNLVTGDEWQLGMGQLTVDDVQVGPAQGAGADLDEHLIVTGRGVWKGAFAKRAAGCVQDHRPHGGTS